MIDFYAAGDGTLRADNKVLKLKGANWFGTEGQHGLPYGLEERGVDEYLGFLEQEGFNALRLLFSHEYVALDPLTLEHDPRDDKLSFDRQKTPALVGSSYLGVLELITSRAAEHGILVLLACHRLRVEYSGDSLHAEWPGSWDGLWYDEEWSEAKILDNWAELARRFCAAWNVIGVDLMNEPHGAGWGRGGDAKDWKLGAQRLGNGVLQHCPRWLILVEGVGYPGEGAVGDEGAAGQYQWGEDLVGVHRAPIHLRNMSKLVYSPHVCAPQHSARKPAAPATPTGPCS